MSVNTAQRKFSKPVFKRLIHTAVSLLRSVGEIETIDWDRIDLGEWTSILIETDNYKELQNMTLDSLTGSGSLLNIDYSTDPNTEITRSERANTLERTINRLDKINLESEKIKTDNSTEVDVTGKKSE